MRNYFCQYRYRNLNACKFHLERHVEYSTGPTADRTNVTLVRSNVFSRAGNTFPWTSASLKITFMESTYPGQRPQSLSLSPHFLLLRDKPQCTTHVQSHLFQGSDNANTKWGKCRYALAGIKRLQKIKRILKTLFS